MKPEIECALLSQDALSRDWLSDEENDYWKDIDRIKQDNEENETLVNH